MSLHGVYSPLHILFFGQGGIYLRIMPCKALFLPSVLQNFKPNHLLCAPTAARKQQCLGTDPTLPEGYKPRLDQVRAPEIACGDCVTGTSDSPPRNQRSLHSQAFHCPSASKGHTEPVPEVSPKFS